MRPLPTRQAGTFLWALLAIVTLCTGKAAAQALQYDSFLILPPDFVVCGELGQTRCPGDLPTDPCDVLPENWHVQPQAINRHGQVVGNISVTDFGAVCLVDRAFIYLTQPAYGLGVGTHYLQAPSDPDFQVESFAYDINDAGIVVGQVDTGMDKRGMIWDLNDADPLVGEDTLPAVTRTAWAVNNADPYEVVGDHASGVAFKWNSGTGQITTHGPAGWANSGAYDLSTADAAASIIVGRSRDTITATTGSCPQEPQGDATAWLPAATALGQPMGFMHPRKSDEIDGEVKGVNDDGVAVLGAGWGTRHVSGECYQSALLWQVSPAVSVVDLGILIDPLDPTVQSRAEAIHLNGTQVVGGDGDANAYIWTLDGSWSAHDLLGQVEFPAPFWDSLNLASDINCNGLICGWGDVLGGILAPKPTGFILCPSCPGNTNGDFVVSVEDLVLVIINWGCTGSCVGDANHDTMVNVQDHTTVILNWGVCPGGDCPEDEPPSFSAALANAGLTQADWDQFAAHVEDDNYRCWMEHHLSGAGGTPDCPGSDPYN